MNFDYDVIVVGGGHAGCEAAVAAARLGVSTLLVTADMNRVAQMSCNPAIGGIAKGQIVREIDALGGMTGIIADRSAIQFRMLNRSKGPAVWSPRVQSDRTLFIDLWRQTLDNVPGLSVVQDMVVSLDIEEVSDCNDGSAPRHRIAGVKTALGMHFKAHKVILTAGTFLNGLMHFGPTKVPGGRISESSSLAISEQLAALGFAVGRMKTGTPARVDGKSIDFGKCEIQWGDDIPVVYGAERVESGDIPALTGKGAQVAVADFHKFSFLPEVSRPGFTRPCFITHTNAESHRILNDNLEFSPLYNGDIKSIGPRYCPSIETKIVTFADKDSHQLFLEPEGANTDEYYINGFSSSLPWEVQLKSLSLVPGLENVHFYRPGYAIEYDYFEPTQLWHSLETRLVSGLYFAGQVNGTTGYEEAAAQGLMAGINAARSVLGRQPVILGRDQAYIGVLIDDLVTKGVDEPYRMFTSRAEYRILLRQDDADMRLTPLGYEIGLADSHRYEMMVQKRQLRDALIEECARIKVKPCDEINNFLVASGTGPLSAGTRAIDLVRRPQLDIRKLSEVLPKLKRAVQTLPDDRREEIAESAEILIKYEGYINRERELAEKARKLEDVKIPSGFVYDTVLSLSTEARQKLSKHRPATIGMASRIPGVSPADINILLLMIRR